MAHLNGKFNAVSDNPMGVLYRQALKRYPHAKFILASRDPREWAQSVRKHIGDRPFVPAERVQYWQYLHERPARLQAVSDERLVAMFRQHQADVKACFENNGIKDRLCLINLQHAPDVTGERLSKFLEVRFQPMLRIDTKKPISLLSAPSVDDTMS